MESPDYGPKKVDWSLACYAVFTYYRAFLFPAVWGSWQAKKCLYLLIS